MTLARATSLAGQTSRVWQGPAGRAALAFGILEAAPGEAYHPCSRDPPFRTVAFWARGEAP